MAACVGKDLPMDVTTALTVVIPSEFHDHINTIRQKYDKAFPRWMPHINLLFPFVGEESFEEIEEMLQPKLEEFGPIELTFDKITHFTQKKQNTYNLQPKDDARLQDLFKIVRDCLPQIKVKHNDFHPHMTLGQAKTSDHTAFHSELSEWLGDGFTVTIESVSMIKRVGQEPFEIKRSLKL